MVSLNRKLIRLLPMSCAQNLMENRFFYLARHEPGLPLRNVEASATIPHRQALLDWAGHE